VDCENEVKIKTSPKKGEGKTKEEVKDTKEGDNNVTEEFEPITGAAKTLCIPFDQPVLKEGTTCFNCGKSAKVWCLWGRSY